MAQLGPYDTHWLTRASFEPTAARRVRMLLLAVVAALAIGAAAGGLYVDGRLPVSRAAEFERRNANLSAELDRARTELEMERATREEVQRHADELSARVTELAHQLEFLNSRGAMAGPAVAPQIAARE